MPAVSGFKPYGDAVSDKEPVFLFYEEYESIRLNDYEKHTQCEAAEVMGVSRPTFTRIYIHAREKIAKAFVEGRQIIVEGGKVELDGSWFECGRCHAIFSADKAHPDECALCGSRDIHACRLATEQDLKTDCVSVKPCCKRKGRKAPFVGNNNENR